MKKNKRTQAKAYKITLNNDLSHPDIISSEKESLTEVIKDYLEEKIDNCNFLELETISQITSIEVSENCNPNTWNVNILFFNECYGDYIDLVIELL